MKRYISKLFAICLAVFIAAGIQAVPANAATTPEGPTPVVSKTITDNGNGTYDITMSVTPYTSSLSQTTPVDVIIIFDSSGSMDEDETGYESYATGRYGLRNSSYVRLYQRTSGWGGYSYSQINNDSYSGTVYVSNGYNYTEYTGERYRRTTRTRLQIAKSAVNMLTSQLLANNTPENPELVQVKVINFASIVRGSSDWMKTATEAENYVNGITLATGDYAGTNWEDALDKSIQTAVRSDENAYVIFISDGDPTFRDTPMVTRPFYQNLGNDRVYGTGYSSDTENVDLCFQAAKPKANDIIESGRHLYSIGVFGDADRMDSLSPDDKYYNATDTDELNTAFTNILNSINYQVKNEDVTLTDGITELTSSFVNTDPSSFRYTKNGADWAEAPVATYENGVVSWNLGNVNTNAVPYTLTFTVWPSQDAYDILADLENGKAYDSLTDKEKEQIVPISGGYGLNTNTEAGLTYTRVDTITTNTEPDGFVEGKPATDGYTYTYDEETGVYTGTLRTEINTPITNPDPIPLTSGKISVVKDWTDSLDNSNRGSSVDFKVLRDGTEYGTITLTAADEWKGEISVAPGLVVGNEPLEDGHEYKIVETTELAGYDGAAAEDFHPMLYDGVLKTSENGTAEIKLTNELMSRLIVSKTVDQADGADEPDPNQLFTFKGTLTGNTGDKYAFSIPAIDGMTDRVDITPDEDGIFWAESGKEFTVQLKDGESFVFNSLPKGVAYEIEENGVDNFTTAVASDTADISDNKASGSIAASNTAYEVNYTNTYTRKTVTAEIPVTKVLELDGLTGPKDIAEKFTFTLTADQGTPLPEVTEIKNPDANGGTVTFGDIEYHETGEYKYTVTESGTVAGVTNDGAKTITVDVTEGEDGKLVASVKGANPTDNDPSYTEFTNKYSINTPATAKIEAKKILHNADLTDGQFNFELTALDGAPEPTSPNASNDADGNIVFGDITYNKPGRYTYTIKETRGELGYYDYDESEKTVTVEVVDNGNGTLSANVVATAIPTFENRYNANSNEVVISAAKNVNGDAAGSDIFNFELVAVTEGAPMPDDATATNNGGSVTFGPITYNANIFAGMTDSNRVKTFEYTIEEVAGNADYYDYDRHKENVTVTVVDKGAGVIEATVSYDEDGAIFNNTYDAEGEVVITANKELDGRELVDGAFTFELYEVVDGVEIPMGEKKNNANGDISFTVGYSVDDEEDDRGTHVYTIKEKQETSLNGVIGYDSDKTVTVEVTDNGDGTLDAAVTEGENQTFTNTYKPKDGKIELTANKVLEGRDSMDAGEFKFVLKDKDDNEVSVGKNDANGVITFEAIEVTATGTYEYVASEEAGTDPSITYDTNTIPYKVKVEDVDGQLTVTEIIKGSGEAATEPKFVNMVNSRLDISKTVKTVGKIAADENQLFTFNIKLSGNDGAKYPFSIMNGDTEVTDASRVSNEDGSYEATSGSEITVHIKDGENIVFENLPIGTEYAVNEVSSAVMGYSFDSITNSDEDATIKDQGTSGTITEPAAVYKIDVVNNFNLNPAEARISVEKILDIPEGLTGPADIKEMFEFELTAADGTPLPEETKIKNPDANGGTAVFGPIVYDTVGTYTYQITESGTVAGITNDSNSSKTVTVDVAYDRENEDLAATVLYPDNGVQTAAPSSVVFTNKYEITQNATAEITAKKVLNRAKLAEGAFEFELSAGTDGAPMPDTEKAVNNADGSIEFGEIIYTMPGTYKYEIKEKASEADFYDYDDATKVVTVTVIDNGNGTLTARVADDGANATFTNTYEAEGSVALIEAAKYVNGEAATKDIFEFTLTANDGGALPEETIVSNEGGMIKFGPIKYDASIFDEPEPEETVADAEATDEAESTEGADGVEAAAEEGAEAEPEEAEGDAPRMKVFHYTIKETQGEAPGYGYDDGSVDVTVTVTDEGEGKLSTDVTYGNKTAFNNTYEASGSITVSGFKNLVGKDLTEGMFKFGVYEGDVLVAEATNDADGNIGFNIDYKVDADGSDVGTHNYTVREIVESPATGMTYDNSSKDLTVDVSDNGDGTLRAEAKIADRLDFENVYKPLPGTYSLEAEKVLEGRSMAAGEFKFELKGEDGEVVASGTNDADGVIKFSPIGFTEVGEYNFTAYEVEGDADNIVYDETEILYHVKVEDVNGKLIASAEAASEATFVNEYIPEDDKPDTGDSTNMALWIAMMLVAGGGLAGSRVLARKKR